MTRRATIALGLVATIGLSALTTLVVSRFLEHRAAAAAVTEGDFHHWVHENLRLTPAQHDALEPAERAFEEHRNRLRGEIAAAGRELAEAVRSGKRDSPAIPEALARLNRAQAELQRETLDHFFLMKDQLDPEQAEKLLRWTHDSLVHQ